MEYLHEKIDEEFEFLSPSISSEWLSESSSGYMES